MPKKRSRIFAKKSRVTDKQTKGENVSVFQGCNAVSLPCRTDISSTPVRNIKIPESEKVLEIPEKKWKSIEPRNRTNKEFISGGGGGYDDDDDDDDNGETT
jgi:hypothetical protein